MVFPMIKLLPVKLLLLVSLVLGGVPTLLAGSDSPVLLADQGLRITRDDLEQALIILPPAEQERIRGDAERIKALLRQIYLERRMLAVAEEQGLLKDPQLQARLFQVRVDEIAAALRAHVEAGMPPPDLTALARERYATQRAELTDKETYRVAHILRKVNCECEREAQWALISDLKARIAAGEDFATLAATYSQDSSATSGGELGGWTSADKLVGPFAKALVALGEGQVSEPVETKFGFHLIRLLGKRPAQLPPFEEVQARLEAAERVNYTRHYLATVQDSYLPSANAQYDSLAIEALRDRD